MQAGVADCTLCTSDAEEALRAFCRKDRRPLFSENVLMRKNDPLHRVLIDVMDGYSKEAIDTIGGIK